MNIKIKNLASNLVNDDRSLADVEVNYNNNDYNWKVYIPSNVSNIDSYLQSIENSIFEDIQHKENIWSNMTEEDKIITKTDPETNQTISYTLTKNDIVKPQIPDNYAIRKSLYPSIGEQLDSYWAGPGSSKYQAMLEKIKNIKQTYPTNSNNNFPEYITATQIRLWLIENNYNLETIEQTISNIEDEKLREKTKAQWEYSPYIERNNSLVNTIGQLLGLTIEQIYQAFLDASKL